MPGEKFDDLDPSKMIAEMREEYWRGLSSADETAAEQRVQVLLLEVGKERFALDADCCRTITKAGKVTRLPRMPGYVLGVINLRGEIVSVIDPGLLFGLGAREVGVKSRLVVVECRGSRVAFLADRVLGIEWINQSRVREPQAGSGSLAGEYVQGHIEPMAGEGWTVYLNAAKLLDSPELSFRK